MPLKGARKCNQGFKKRFPLVTQSQSTRLQLFCSVFANYDLKILKEKKLKSIFNNQVCSRLIKGHLKLFLFLASSHEMPCFTGISAFNCIPLWVHER